MNETTMRATFFPGNGSRLCQHVIAVLLLAGLFLSVSLAQSRKGAAGWKSIFDGKTLNGWSAPDMSYFRVEDGAITGETTKEHNPPRNQFIVWQGGEVGDFELKFRFRIFGAKSNSGMQFRSEVKEHGLVHGYQADIDGAGKYFAGIWDEYGPRRSLAGRGERVVIDESGKRAVTRFAGADALAKGVALSRWTEYHITAEGARMTLRINGKLMAELEDRETGKARLSGVLAMPIIPGEPMRVQYRDIRLRILPTEANAKAARISHPALRAELLGRERKDQDIRNEWIRAGVNTPSPELISRMQAIGADNEARMREILGQYGWPGPDQVGRDGAEAAFLLVQHADIELQKQALPLVREAYRKAQLSGQGYALLTDRVLVREGKPQLYGTQAKSFDQWKGTEPVLQPIEDEANVDKRRAEVGLPPLAEYLKGLREVNFPAKKGKS
ncbi:MAG: DUF6624 domain-containing protein [Blastocatellia bacterium]